jgi:hypothetical protein
MLPVAAVARRLGVAPATLRTWDRRYGLGPSGHATGRHRRYDARDVARLELMQRALLRGVAPAEAAHYALTSLVDGVPEVLTGNGSATRERPPDGSRLRLPGASRLARGLGAAVLAMDSIAAQALLADAIEVIGVARAWDEVIRPVMSAVAARWASTGIGIEADHLLRECVLGALLRATPLATSPRNPRPVLLAGMPGEWQSLPLYGLAAALAVRRLGTRMLGAAVPADALLAAVRRTAPAVVVLWAHLPRNADAGPLVALPRGRQRVRLFLGGPGWQAAGMHPHQLLPEGMDAAATEVERTILGQAS